GGLVNIAPVRPGPRGSGQGKRAGRLPVDRAAVTGIPRRPPKGEVLATTAPCASTPQERLAARYQALGRTLKDQGQLAQAQTAWLHALDLLTELMVSRPDISAARQRWCECANSLAWLMVSAKDRAVRDPAQALSLAGKAVEAHPECGTYWNT